MINWFHMHTPIFYVYFSWKVFRWNVLFSIFQPGKVVQERNNEGLTQGHTTQRDRLIAAVQHANFCFRVLSALLAHGCYSGRVRNETMTARSVLQAPSIAEPKTHALCTVTSSNYFRSEPKFMTLSSNSSRQDCEEFYKWKITRNIPDV